LKIDTELAEVPFTALPGPKLAWMKLWVADLLTSSFVLSLSELDFARYVKLLMRAWESDTPCFLPNDVVILSRFAGASSLKSFKQSWAIIQSHFIVTRDGKYVFNSKERLTFKKQVELNRNSIENGKKNNNYSKNQQTDQNLGIPSAIPSDLPTGIPAPARGLKVLKEIQDQNLKSLAALAASQSLKIYEAYPKHVGKKDALRAILKVLKEIPFEELLPRVEKYKKQVFEENKEKQYIPYPATWFNGGRYNDEDLVPKPTPIWREVSGAEYWADVPSVMQFIDKEATH